MNSSHLMNDRRLDPKRNKSAQRLAESTRESSLCRTYLYSYFYFSCRHGTHREYLPVHTRNQLLVLHSNILHLPSVIAVCHRTVINCTAERQDGGLLPYTGGTMHLNSCRVFWAVSRKLLERIQMSFELQTPTCTLSSRHTAPCGRATICDATSKVASLPPSNAVSLFFKKTLKRSERSWLWRHGP